jgi:hypothetical protein
MQSEKFVVGHKYYTCDRGVQPEGTGGMVSTWDL